MLQNPRVTAFAVSELLRENQQGGTVIPTHIRVKVGLSPTKKFCLLQWKSFKNDEKCFLFHLKSSFCSQDIQVFMSWLFGHVEKMAWFER